MSDAYYPESDPGIMETSSRMRADSGPYPPRVLTVAESFAYRAACARQGIEFTDGAGNHVLDGSQGGPFAHACRGSWHYAGTNAEGHEVYTCDVRSHRAIGRSRIAGHVCADVLACTSGTVTAVPGEAGDAIARHCAQARAGYFYCEATPADPCGWSAARRHPHDQCTAQHCAAREAVRP